MRRSLDHAGNWTRLPALNGTTQPEFTDDIGHHQPSMANLRLYYGRN
ncbi:hypothetical protein HDA40_007799 [Hamadaea flava]|uniref:Uncharacterized protein n=1 Tax=Hamadaea flava TaxID=1742688 RepID=A0ABV8LXW6_9ACTN|nr:hypothetical protein [Hamadaea flava]MCP2329292.1 hypothetical protein [Hamadaea flava]